MKGRPIRLYINHNRYVKSQHFADLNFSLTERKWKLKKIFSVVDIKQIEFKIIESYQ